MMLLTGWKLQYISHMNFHSKFFPLLAFPRKCWQGWVQPDIYKAAYPQPAADMAEVVFPWTSRFQGKLVSPLNALVPLVAMLSCMSQFWIYWLWLLQSWTFSCWLITLITSANLLLILSCILICSGTLVDYLF